MTDRTEDQSAQLAPLAATRPSRLRLLFPALTVSLLAAAFLMWSRDDGRASALPPAPLPPPAPVDPVQAAAEAPLAPPAPSARTREEQRFARADRDDDGEIVLEEYLANRRRNFDRLDANGNGRLEFAEYAVEGREKFAKADADGNARLDAAEYATTAAKPRAAKPACACG